MLKRKIDQKLIDWKKSKEHKPLIIKGCRQCGKTFSVLEFAKNNYKNVVYLNFFENPDYASFREYMQDGLMYCLKQTRRKLLLQLPMRGEMIRRNCFFKSYVN